MITKQPVLIMIQGPEPGSFYKLPDNRVTTIGRSSRNTIRTVGPSVSRFHCEVAWVNGSWQLTDLNSKKGTIVNGDWIEDRCTLKPGDIVRLSTTVFRFDMIEESRLRDGAMMAIVEAEMDLKFAPRGEASGSLEDIRARSRLETLDARGRRQSQQSALKLNMAFLAVTAAAVGLAVTALLFYAHRRAQGAPAVSRAERQADALYQEALAAAEGGDVARAVRGLWDLEREFPRTRTAEAAAQARRGITWAAAEQKLSRAPELEAQSNHAAALELYDELEGLHPDDTLKDIVRRNREYTVRLAHAAFAELDRAAEGKAQAGEKAAALALYRQARERIGVPELVARAEAKAAELGAPDSP